MRTQQCADWPFARDRAFALSRFFHKENVLRISMLQDPLHFDVSVTIGAQINFRA